MPVVRTVPAVPPEQRDHLRMLPLAVTPQSASLARRYVRALAATDCPADLDTVTLVASELVTNGVQAAGLVRTWSLDDRPIQLRVEYAARYTLVSVTDPGPGLPQRRTAGEEDESGRGLAIIETLATDTWPTSGPRSKTIHVLIAHPGVTLIAAEISAVRLEVR